MSNLWGWFFQVFLSKKERKKKNIVASELKKLHKLKSKKNLFFLKKILFYSL